ncbi:MAG: LPS translocon maturation chaperone LptM [Aeromonadaceae bacterium]
MNKPKFVWRGLLLLALTQLTACGLKGPLYMPKDAPKDVPKEVPKEVLPAQEQSKLVEQTLGAAVEP